MKERILSTLQALRSYALGKPGVEVTFFYHEEDSTLMRFANSAISLNTNEHLIRLDITAYAGRKRASYEMITNLDSLEEMKRAIDTAAEMVQHAQPLNYQPTIPVFAESFSDEKACDPALAALTNAERLAYFNKAVASLETDDLRLSGIFSSGVNVLAQINTRSEHTQYFKASDAQVTAVLAHNKLKWEIIAEQSAQKKSDLKPAALQHELAFLVQHYNQDEPGQLPLGSYDIVFGSAAIAEMINFMNFIGFNGGIMKRGYSFLTEENVGQKVLSSQVTISDDPRRIETFPFQRDFTGIVRRPLPVIENGVFRGFHWMQDDADEFGAQATGHTVGHKSLVMAGGTQAVASLQDLVKMPRDADILYVPFLHYMNLVNPTKGLITGSSRFGALLLKKDGSVMVPYNVRLTQSLLDVFGDKVAWLSKTTLPYNTSHSYGARNPTAIVVPAFMRVNGLEISHSNSSY